MKKLFIIILFFALNTLQAQDRYIFEFEKLPSVTNIKDFREITKLKQEASEIFDANFFYTTNYQIDNIISSAIVYRKGNDWTIYETPFGGDRMFPHFVGYSENKQYAFFQVESISHIARGSETSSTGFYIIDLVNGSFVYFEKEYYQHHWWFSEENISHHSIYSTKSQIIVENKKLIVLESEFAVWYEGSEKNELDEKFGKYDSQSGIYEIQEQKLVKTHYYDRTTKRMNPIIYAGKIGLGMVLRDVTDIYNTSYGIELKKVPQFVYGYDSEKNGFELWVSDKPLYFIIAPDPFSEIRRIEHLTVLSPEISVHGLHTDMTIKNVLDKYPNAELKIDLVNDWEYIYLRNLNLRLEFKTNKDNRIAQYKLNEKNENEDFIATKILNENRKIDFITIVK